MNLMNLHTDIHWCNIQCEKEFGTVQSLKMMAKFVFIWSGPRSNAGISTFLHFSHPNEEELSQIWQQHYWWLGAYLLPMLDLHQLQLMLAQRATCASKRMFPSVCLYFIINVKHTCYSILMN